MADRLTQGWQIFKGTLTSDPTWGIVYIPNATIAFAFPNEFADPDYHLQYNSGAEYVVRRKSDGQGMPNKTINVIAFYQ